MQIEKRLKNHYMRWNITLDYEEKFSNFKNRLIKIINDHIGNYLAKNPDIDQEFKKIFELHKANEPSVRKSCLSVSVYNDIPKLPSGIHVTEKGFGDTYIYECMSTCESLQELATIIQIIFWTLEVKYDEIKEELSAIVKEIKKISILTPSASFMVHRKGKQLIVYPNGDRFLDEGIINCTLSGLEKYPKAAEAFEEALKIYLNGEESQYRNLLDNLRFALEQLLKKVLNNEKSLENQKDNLLRWLKSNDLHTQVVNLYQALLKIYQDYQNNAVKHKEDFSLDEIEFMIYLTGNLMRLILQLASAQDK